jgi:Ca2+-binding EF-hand superfamily protein
MNLNAMNIKNYLKQEFIDLILLTFKKFDKEGKGAIPSKDLGMILQLLGYNPTKRELNEMMDILEEDPQNPKGLISKEGLIACVARKSRDSDTIDEFIESFKVFDKDNKGIIEEKYLRYILCKTGDIFDEIEIELFMKESIPFQVTQNDSKFVKYVEFAMFLKDLYKPPPAEKGEKKEKGKK